MRGVLQEAKQGASGFLSLVISGIKFRCFQTEDKLGAKKRDIVEYDAIHDNDARFAGTIVWIRKVGELPPVKAFNLGDIRTAETKTAAPMIDTLKKNKKNLTDEERETVMKAKAIWHHGPKGEPSPAVWKSEVDGETWFVTNTHRAFLAKKTLDSAINAFHDVIKNTAAKK